MHTTEDNVPIVRRGPARVARLRLVFSTETLVPPTTFTPLRGSTPIGREVPAGIQLTSDTRASRQHATLHLSALGTLRIVDEKSRNGTFVNGQRVEDALLEDGDIISIGNSFVVVRFESEDSTDAPVPALMGTAPCMRALRSTIHKVAPTRTTVLLLGESGCGKEVVARAIHEIGRADGPFIAVNCSAIPESLAESQLFGHVAGAFSGAVARPGLFRAAHGGTLFLDEVGDLPLAIQPKLLRVLQDRMVLAVGATNPVACDVRIVAATNRDLRTAVARQDFRGDLFARLSEFPVEIPPLRQRREDVLELLLHALGPPRPCLSSALVEALLFHHWPFNVREIFGLAAQLRIHAGSGDKLDLDLIADKLGAPMAPPTIPSENAGERDDDRADGGEREPPPDKAELEAMLEKHHGIIADVARAMRRSRKQVYRWIADRGIDVNRFRG